MGRWVRARGEGYGGGVGVVGEYGEGEVVDGDERMGAGTVLQGLKRERKRKMMTIEEDMDEREGFEFKNKNKKQLIWPRVAQKTEAKRWALWPRVRLNRGRRALYGFGP